MGTFPNGVRSGWKSRFWVADDDLTPVRRTDRRNYTVANFRKGGESFPDEVVPRFDFRGVVDHSCDEKI